MSRSFLCASAALLVLVPLHGAIADPFVRLDDYSGHDLQVVGFELSRPVTVSIEAVGVDDGYRSNGRRDSRRGWSRSWGRGWSNGWWGDSDRGPLATAWLLDSATRQVVWSQVDSRSDRDEEDRWTYRVKDTVELKPGRYELYAWGAPYNAGMHFFGFSGLRDAVRSIDRHADRDRDGNRDRDRGPSRRAFRDCRVELSADGVREADVTRFEPNGEFSGALYRAAGLGDEAFVRSGLRVDRPVNVRVYSLIEMPRDWRQAADGGWIVNTATRERVWDASHRDVEPAGGAEKNGVYDEEIRLEPGSYEICFGTDDSHSTDEWNSAPPYDPLNWGVTLLPGKDFDPTAFHVEGEVTRPEPVVDLTRVRDNDSVEKRFRLAREADVLVYALGEWNDGADEFADGGWITDARGSVVWEMTDRNTESAGGAEKNRMFDGLVRLPAGDYTARYDSDDSHAYRDWNSAAPWDQQAWGLALYPGPGASAADFQVSDVSTADMDGAVLRGDAVVSIVRVRDDEHRRDKFTLDADGRVHIRAIGEGDGGEMFDYAWIENDRTGRTVWEMTWRNTRHAGGASKNRIFDDEVSLDAGSYEVHYVTDGSHSYRRWNARKPRDPDAWGITITRDGR